MPSATKVSLETMTSGPLVIRGIHSAEFELLLEEGVMRRLLDKVMRKIPRICVAISLPD